MQAKGQAALTYDALVFEDLEKCEALLRCDKFWSVGTGVVSRAKATAECAVVEVPSIAVRCPHSRARAQRAKEFKEGLLQAQLAARMR